MKVMQSFNKKTGRWVKYRKYADGRTEITDVKQKEPKKPFKRIKRR